MAARLRHLFQFDDYKIEVEERRVLHNDLPVQLNSRDFDILLALVRQAGETVNKDDLIETVWKDTFVEEGNLNRHVSTIRRVLGDDPRSQRLIKTIPKLGYRFTADVREIVEESAAVSVQNTASTRVTVREEITEGFWTTSRTAIVAGALVLVAGMVAAWSLTRPDPSLAKTRISKTVEAADAFREGRELWRDRTPEGLHKATLLLERATSLDPNFALAHAALADAYAFDYGNWRKAGAAAQRAIDIDPELGQPHASIGFVRMFWEWRVADAQAELKKAIELQPEYAAGHQWYALSLAATGARDAALVEIEKAALLEPQSVAINTDKCQMFYFAERFKAAQEQCEKVLQLDPDSQNARELLYQIAMSSGRYDDAVNLFAEMSERSKSDDIRTAAVELRNAYRKGGIDGFRAAQITFYTKTAPSAYKLARVVAETGDIQGAVGKLKEAAVQHDFDLIFYPADPAFKLVRTSSEVGRIDGLSLQ